LVRALLCYDIEKGGVQAVSILNQIETVFPQLARQERKLALLVLQHPEKVQEMHITELAQAAGIGTATVTRFVKKMGCADYSTFKVQLAAAQGIQVPPPDTGTVGDQVFSIYSKMLQGTWAQLDMQQLEQVIAVITQARRVYVYGQGSSGYTAEEFVQRLIRMGIAAFCTTDTHMMFINASIMTATDIVIVLSTSGSSREVNEAARMAKANGAQIVGITGSPKSPLAGLVDFAIVVKNANFVDTTRFVNSQFASMYALDIITTMLLDNDLYRQRLQGTVELIMDRKLHHE
jgi:DNA-binding MurR/RpiR family transcriptional regulator